MKVLDDDNFEYSTGKQVYASSHIIGIDPNGSISDGYDGSGFDSELINLEKEELADYAIDLWKKYKEEIYEKS